jgi:Fe-S cluster assembly ATP-binding protein
MGPNGSGKSTLANVLMGNPLYEVTDGEILLDGENVLELEADERSRKGLFLAFQYPVTISGVTLANFLRHAINARLKAIDPDTKGMPIPQFAKMMREKMNLLGIDHSFAGRYLNEGFSGGEKKRAEVLQMAVLEPKIAVLDETDSGLDIDALRIVSEGVNKLTGPNMGSLVITHYQRMLNYIKPDQVHVMLAGQIVESGGPELALQLEEQGYDWLREKYGIVASTEEA